MASSPLKRLFAEKSEDAAALISRIIAEPSPKIVLVVPNGSVLRDSDESFVLIAREAESAGKLIAIESVDDAILALAEAAGMKAVHPLFKKKSAMSDIVTSSASAVVSTAAAPEEGAAQPAPPTTKVSGQASAKAKRVGRKPSRSASGGKKAMKPDVVAAPLGGAEPEAPESAEEPLPQVQELQYEESRPRRRRRIPRKAIVAGAAVVVLVVGAWGASAAFGRATVTINLKKTPWSFDDTVTVSKASAAIDAEQGRIPGEEFRESRNLTKLFPATGKAEAKVKATGKLVIYNTATAAPQTLIATTRFETPDGKIFRLASAVTVPAASATGGAMTPGSIAANVIADQPGEEYNMGAVARLTIPGFKGSPKYATFYGALPDGASGGSSTGKPVATDQDVDDAKGKTAGVLNSSLQGTLIANYAEEFVIPDGASGVSVSKLTVNRTVNADGNFSIFSEAQLIAIGFKEEALRSFLLARAQNGNADLVFKDLKIQYAEIKPDFAAGALKMRVTASGSLATRSSADEIKQRIAGKGIGEVRAALMLTPGVSDAQLSLWPFWLNSVPADERRVTVEIR